jgi:type VI secretion system protein ImpB
MGSESLQHKLDRVRRPRVQITYDVETNGVMRAVELPFVVGVIADLSAQRKEPLPPMKERKFTPIDRDNFHDVLAKAAPRLALKVADQLTGDGKLAVELTFRNLEDFEPARLAGQVPPLRELMETRQKLSQLLAKMEGNDRLETLLADVISKTEQREALAKRFGGDAGDPETTTPAKEETK